MLTTDDVAMLYEAILSIPGMDETVRIDVKISRTNVLLLYSSIERGLLDNDNKKSSGLLDITPQETRQELMTLANDFLHKAGLTELHNKLKTLEMKSHGK